ncbi:hypothetical protein [Paraglaciecola marina]|uniref:hypothetical protein n=1 Tax=Paraglaciecola marina TaxID=2500157 RepID=UPI00105FFCE1|nr:hypothetical protein [Paraglaciecola marina]
MFSFLKKKEPQYIVVNLNARLQPMHRGELYEEALEKLLRENKLGEVSGGGTLQSQSGEIESCDIEIEVKNSNSSTIEQIRLSLEKIGTPKGSKIVVEKTEEEIPIGELEGLAIYLNGTDLPDKIYEESDSNFVYNELDRLTEGHGSVASYWQGQSETAFYLYGKSFETMDKLIQPIVASYPLCQKCRIERIA